MLAGQLQSAVVEASACFGPCVREVLAYADCAVGLINITNRTATVVQYHSVEGRCTVPLHSLPPPPTDETKPDTLV
jgi:hypothetical protein